MLSKYAQMVLLQNKYESTLVDFYEDQDNLRYALITFVLRYTPH